MNVAYINPFIVACREVCDTMIHVPLSLGHPHLRERQSPLYKVSTVIGLSGAAQGIIVLTFSEAVALALVSGLTGEPVTSITPDVLDALSEIINMVAGSAKKNLPGGQVNISLPKVAQMADEVSYPPGVPVIVIPCDTGPGRFVIEVAISQCAEIAPTPAPETKSQNVAA